jgi:3-methylfumaryl-CoA hydratase
MEAINLQDWLGKTEEIQDRIYTTPAKALALTLDYKDFEAIEGNALPEIWYWLYFLPIVPMSEVGQDGHPKRGGFLPPITLERRMWASGSLTFYHDLVIGEEIRKTSEIVKISEKEGKAGKLVFVTVKHLIQSAARIAVQEEQNIVYLHMPKSFVEPKPNPIPDDLDWNEVYPVDPVLLFRFSALTFNGHRIHYDWKYATEVEKYPGLVVQGPLQALLLLESAKNHNPGRKPANFDFRAIRPIFAFDELHICGKSNPDGSQDIYTANADGNIGMQATITWR